MKLKLTLDEAEALYKLLIHIYRLPVEKPDVMSRVFKGMINLVIIRLGNKELKAKGINSLALIEVEAIIIKETLKYTTCMPNAGYEDMVRIKVIEQIDKVYPG